MAVDRLSAADHMTLVTDRGPAPMNIGAVLVVDDGDSLNADRVRSVVAARLGTVPRLRQRLVRHGPGRPCWVDVGGGTEQHVRVHHLPDAGDRALLAFAAGVVCTPLPRDRPLWTARWVTGVGEGRAALVLVLHHVVADGIGALSVLTALADEGSAPPLPERTRATGPTAAPSRHALARTWQGLRDLGLTRRPRAAPRTSFNRPTGPRRRFGVVEVPLAPVLAAARARSCTVNDLVVAAVTGAIARALAERGEQVPELVVSVPQSSRRPGDAARLGNATAVVPFRVDVRGPVTDRVRLLAAQTRRQRVRPRGASAAPLGLLFRALARLGLFRVFIEHQRFVNTFVSNVRGPEAPIRLCGRTVSRIVPTAVTPGNTAATVTVLSYAGRLVATVVTDPDVVPDPERLDEHLRRELDAVAGPG